MLGHVHDHVLSCGSGHAGWQNDATLLLPKNCFSVLAIEHDRYHVVLHNLNKQSMKTWISWSTIYFYSRTFSANENINEKLNKRNINKVMSHHPPAPPRPAAPPPTHTHIGFLSLL